MRSRKKILEYIEQEISRNNGEIVEDKVIIELLLDIRDLLKKRGK